MRAALPIVALAACAGNASTKSPQPSNPCAVDGVTGTIPGVILAIRSDACTLPRGTAVTFTYEVTTTSAVPAIAVPGSGGGCSSCATYTTDPLTFVSARIGGTATDGTAQSYCVCDQGCCAPTQDQTIQPIATTSSAPYMWSGRTWGGPSDTGNPEGDFFLPGSYFVTVTFDGFAAGTVVAQLPIEIVAP
jgi:hypothetical protein